MAANTCTRCGAATEGRRHRIRTLGLLRVFGGALLVFGLVVGAFLAMLGAMALLAKGDQRRVRRVMRIGLLKSYNNTTRKFAGHRHFPFALLTHVGRRSGRTHQSPLGAITHGDGLVLPLAWGRQVDWCQNVLAAGTCTLTWQGQIHELERPEIISAADVAPVWPTWKRMAMRLLRIEDFLWLHHRTPRPETAAGHRQAVPPA